MHTGKDAISASFHLSEVASSTLDLLHPKLADRVWGSSLQALLVSFAPRSGGKDLEMKFEYTFVTGKVSIDVDEEWVSILKDLDHEEAKNERKETRRHCSLGACPYEGESFASEDTAFERFLESDSAKSLITPALEVLTKKQKEVVEALFYNHQTAKEFADSRGVCEMAVSKLRKAALKRIENFLRKKV